MSTPLGASADDSDSAPLLGNQNIKAAAEKIEERPVNWAYLKYFMIRNLALVVVSFPVLVLSREEKAAARLWWWLAGYVIQSLVHMACLSTKYWNQGAAADGGGGGGFAVKLNSSNSVVSVIWWLIGFNWLLGVNSAYVPQLYWLCAILLASEAFLPVVIAVWIVTCCVIGLERATEAIERLFKVQVQRQNAENTDQGSFADSPMEDAECST